NVNMIEDRNIAYMRAEPQQGIVGAVAIPPEAATNCDFAAALLQQETPHESAERVTIRREARVQIAVGQKSRHSLPRRTVDAGKATGEVNRAVGIERGWSVYAP